MGSVSSVDEDIIVAPGRQYQRQCQPCCCRLADDPELSEARGVDPNEKEEKIREE